MRRFSVYICIMFPLEGFPKLKSVYWQNLKPGMIYSGGVHINDSTPPELYGYPVLTDSLLGTLKNKYRFLDRKPVLVLEPDPSDLSPREISDVLLETERKIILLNGFRSSVLEQKRKIGNPNGAVLHSTFVEKQSLILDQLNSGLVVMDSGALRPSLLSDLNAAVTITDVLTGRSLAKFNFPRDIPFELHLVVDYSYSMQASGRDPIVQGALSMFCTSLEKLFPQAVFHVYAFSDKCIKTSFPLSGKEVPRGETSYESFVKKILHQQGGNIPNKVILFSDGLPDNISGAREYLARFREQKIDYTQIIFCIEGDKREFMYTDTSGVLDGYLLEKAENPQRMKESEYREHVKKLRERFSELAMSAHGNQIILTVDQAAGVVAVEAFDRWLGYAAGRN